MRRPPRHKHKRDRWRRAVGSRIFLPTDVAEVNAGLWWDPALGVTGLGTAGFSWAEQNGHAAAAQVQATVVKQPAPITINGNTFWRIDDETTDGRMLSTGSIVSGFPSTSLYLGFWHQMPDGTPTSGVSTIFAHNTVGAGLRRFLITNDGLNEKYSATVSQDGTATGGATWDASVDYAAPHWVEVIFSPNSLVMFVDFVLRSTVSSNMAAIASLNDPSVPISLGAPTGAAVNQNPQYLGPLYYLPTAPSLAARKAIATNHAGAALPAAA